jgi:hypothetical protein
MYRDLRETVESPSRDRRRNGSPGRLVNIRSIIRLNRNTRETGPLEIPGPWSARDEPGTSKGRTGELRADEPTNPRTYEPPNLRIPEPTNPRTLTNSRTLTNPTNPRTYEPRTLPKPSSSFFRRLRSARRSQWACVVGDVRPRLTRSESRRKSQIGLPP